MGGRALARVLLVDDDEQYLTRVLARPFEGPFEACMCRGFADAVRVVEASRTLAGAVIDVGLGDGDGYQLAVVVRERFPAATIALISGGPHDELLNAAAAIRVSYLLKGGCEESLRRLGEHLLDASRGLPFAIAEQVLLVARRAGLTAAETRVLEAGIVDEERQDIAERLEISPETVKKHTEAIRRKLGRQRFADVVRDVRRTIVKALAHAG